MPANDRRHQLLDTALDVFAKRGYEGATTKEIASAAGVTEAVIFRHFPTKQALYLALLEHQSNNPRFREWLEEARNYMEKNDDEGLFRSIIRQILRGYREDCRCQRVVLFAALEGHEEGLKHHRESSMPTFELLNEYILRRQQDGAISADLSPTAILCSIAGMATHFGMMTQMFGFDCCASDETITDEFTRILFKGILPEIGKRQTL
jgi:TetR/AcrR family transcriptional regulator